jgi:purine-binding chemotaxis protein CheW
VPGMFCTFFVNGQFFGVPVEQVQEVIRYQEMTRVPLVSQVVRGLINLRGQIVVAIDLRQRLGAGLVHSDQKPMNVVVRTSDGAVSLLVDEIGDVLEVKDDAFEPPPETLPLQTRTLVRGVYKLQKRLLLVLDTNEAATVTQTDARLGVVEATV